MFDNFLDRYITDVLKSGKCHLIKNVRKGTRFGSEVEKQVVISTNAKSNSQKSKS